MMPTTFIHIGAPKTGSTAIQHFATENRHLLSGLGLLYPETALRGLGHHDFAFLLDGGYPDWAKPQDAPLDLLAGRLKDECAGFDGDLLLSSENFYLRPQPEKLRTLIEETGLDNGRAVRIVVYLRRQDDMLVSWYNQLVKAQGFSGSFADAAGTWFWLGDYRQQLLRWARAFGAKNLIVRRYPERDGPGVLADFWSIVCPDCLSRVEPQADGGANISLNRDLLEVQRIINRLPLPIIEKRRFHHEMMRLSAQGGDVFSDAPVASRAELNALLARYDEGNDDVARTYLNGEPLFPSPAKPDGAETVYGGLALDKVVAALAWIMLNR